MALEGARLEGGGRVQISDGSEGEPGQVAATVGTNVEVVAALAQALEKRDPYTGEHSESVVDLTERVAQAMGVDEDDIKDVRTATLLHDGLAGDAIPLAARIILACYAYHAMVSDRPYRRAMSHHDAMAELTSNAGSQFDPEVVQALVGYLVGRRQAGLEAVELSGGAR